MTNQGSQLQIAGGSSFFCVGKRELWQLMTSPPRFRVAWPMAWKACRFPIQMKCMRQLGGWKSMRCCLPCSNVYYILIIHFCNSSFVYGIWQLYFWYGNFPWPLLGDRRLKSLLLLQEIAKERESHESLNFTEALRHPSNLLGDRIKLFFCSPSGHVSS